MGEPRGAARACVRVRACVRASARAGRVTDQVSVRAPRPWARPPPHSLASCRRGAGPAAELLLFIHRLCLLWPLPFFLPGPAPACPHPTPAFRSQAPVPRGRGQAPRPSTGVRGAGPPLPVSRFRRGPPSQTAPGGQGWADRRGLAGGTRVCVSRKSLWWVGRVSSAGGVTGGGEE